MPDPSPPSTNGFIGRWGQVANLTAVGMLGVFLFWFADRSFALSNRFNDNANEFHRDIYQELATRRANDAARDAKIDQLVKDAAEIKWRLAFQSGGLSALFPPPGKQP